MATTTELRAFHLVAEAGSFSQAARDGRVSQSTLSIQVRAIERDSGQSLFERMPRGVRLTERGEELFHFTSHLFAAEASAQALLTRQPAQDGGYLRIVADGAALPARILSRLSKDLPDLQFILQIRDSSQVIAALQDLRADVGITACQIVDDRIHAQPLAQAQLVAWLPMAHDLVRHDAIALADLVRAPLIVRAKGSQTRAVLEANLALQRLPLPAAIEVDLQESLRELVAAGFGAGVGSSLEPLHDPRITTRPIVDAPVQLIEQVVCIHERRRSPTIRRFMQLATMMDWTATPA